MKVFISHSHRDKDAVRRIAADLENKGITVLLDENIIRPGDSWAGKLSQAIDEVDAIVVVVSSNTASSQWQTSEIAFAISASEKNASKKVIPVILDRKAEMPFFLRSLQASDLSDDKAYANNFPQLVQALQHSVSVVETARISDSVRVEVLKAQRHMLDKEVEALASNKVTWGLSILGALASIIGASLVLVTGYLGNIKFGYRTMDFLVGVLAGILASLIAFYASRLVTKKTTGSEATHGK